MNTRIPSILIALLATTTLCAQKERPKVLFLTHSAGFVHPVVKRMQKTKLAHAEKQFLEAAADQFEVVPTQDCSMLKNLDDFRAVVFYTTGELPVDEETKQGLIDFVRNGGGFAGTHCATDTFYKLPEYGEMIGGYFDGHPWHQKVAIKVEDRTHPASIRLGESFEITDEIYQFKQFSRERVHVLMSLDHDSFDVSRGKRKDNDYAISWTRDYGKGRVFYTALGHRVEVWRDPRFLNHFVTGVRWAMNCEDELAKPPADADILFDGNDTSAWQHVNGKPVAWTIADGAMTVKRPGGSIVTKQAFNDFRLHVEFRVPAHPAKVKGQARGNSGVYLQQRYELQILDSYGLELKPSDCGGLYRRKAADVNMCRAPGEWQSYDIWFTAARFSDGKKTAKARITAIHNGVKIHDDVEIDGKTGAGKPEGPEPMPILLQDHGNPVSFRNIWIIPG